LENETKAFSKGKDMSRFVKQIVSFLANEDGPTSVEYAVMLALIVVVCLVSITNLGTKVNGTFNSVGVKLAGS
jgi:pilus assembly protein Flp/PilA